MNRELLEVLILISGLTDTEIAKKLGMSMSSYYNKKRGDTAYTRDEIAAFAEILDTPEIRKVLDDLRNIKSARDIFFWNERCL